MPTDISKLSRVLAVNTSSVSISGNVVFGANSSNSAANGFVNLPGSLKMNWGWVSATSSAGDITFSSPYSVNVYSVVATSNNSTQTFEAVVISINATSASIRTGNTSATNVRWIAIGT